MRLKEDSGRPSPSTASRPGMPVRMLATGLRSAPRSTFVLLGPLVHFGCDVGRCFGASLHERSHDVLADEALAQVEQEDEHRLQRGGSVLRADLRHDMLDALQRLTLAATKGQCGEASIVGLRGPESGREERVAADAADPAAQLRVKTQAGA